MLFSGLSPNNSNPFICHNCNSKLHQTLQSNFVLHGQNFQLLLHGKRLKESYNLVLMCMIFYNPKRYIPWLYLQQQDMINMVTKQIRFSGGTLGHKGKKRLHDSTRKQIRAVIFVCIYLFGTKTHQASWLTWPASPPGR